MQAGRSDSDFEAVATAVPLMLADPCCQIDAELLFASDA
jgi:hypothetical protein